MTFRFGLFIFLVVVGIAALVGWATSRRKADAMGERRRRTLPLAVPIGHLDNGLHFKAPWQKVSSLDGAIQTDNYYRHR